MTRRIRICLHALDRTGPPVLARSFLHWLVTEAPAWDVQVVAFRGGALSDEMRRLAPVHVMLDDHEPWDHSRPEPERAAQLRAAAAGLAPADVTLLVSVAAGQCLTMTSDDGAVVTWVVEQGEDLHWLHGPVGVASRTHGWLAGAERTADELADALGPDPLITVVPEFIEAPLVDTDRVARLRANLLDAEHSLLIVGAGIGTWRKAPDLFLEVALSHQRMGARARWVWVGGEEDPLVPVLEELCSEMDLGGLVRWVPNTAHLDEYLAAADLMVHPARLDAFPLVCLHAAALGTPVVAFDGVGGVPEMFREAFAGTGYPDVRGLAEIVAGLEDSGSRRHLADEQRRRVLERFLAPVAAPALLAQLEQARVGRRDRGALQ